MRRGWVLAVIVGGAASLAGCQEQPRKVHETTIKTPRGTTTITIEKDQQSSPDR